VRGLYLYRASTSSSRLPGRRRRRATHSCAARYHPSSLCLPPRPHQVLGSELPHHPCSISPPSRHHLATIFPPSPRHHPHHLQVRGWLGSEVARLLPQEYAGTAEAAPTKGSPHERGTAQLVLLSKLVLYKLYTLVRIGHELKLEAPLTRRGVARVLCEAIARPERAKGLPAANTFCKNAFNPMPHQVLTVTTLTVAVLSVATPTTTHLL
jgi:hypothetical protein